MGRYDFRPLRVHQAATQLLETQKIRSRPPWYDTIANVPPSQQLVRPILRRPVPKHGRRASRMFVPEEIRYDEDKLRREFFGDHPWELARPRVVLEEDGKDRQRHDWSKIRQPGKQLDGESVIQRQLWLMEYGHHAGTPNDPSDPPIRMTRARAYDIARKEFYAIRHEDEIARRVAHEEALSTGAYFGKSAVEVGMQLEDQQYEAWKEWAIKEIATLRQTAGAVYTGTDNEEALLKDDDSETDAAVEEVEGTVPGSEKGLDALGGAAVHP
ncbi:hypothetical protein B0A49_12147 [Cryomyces minteri]|uniref:Small ribosomal subunit protein mS23 n=1 Tax=Cryomyces minteri TaxID=331657 RepID=A0A4U0VRL8_9PEZI|nr:hypothetical protein B0A49_12147 [Cryomyces minteri]